MASGKPDVQTRERWAPPARHLRVLASRDLRRSPKRSAHDDDAPTTTTARTLRQPADARPSMSGRRWKKWPRIEPEGGASGLLDNLSRGIASERRMNQVTPPRAQVTMAAAPASAHSAPEDWQICQPRAHTKSTDKRAPAKAARCRGSACDGLNSRIGAVVSGHNRANQKPDHRHACACQPYARRQKGLRPMARVASTLARAKRAATSRLGERHGGNVQRHAELSMALRPCWQLGGKTARTD